MAKSVWLAMVALAVLGCGDDNGVDGAALHAAAAEALTSQMSSCALSPSCHQGRGKAQLVLLDVPDLHTALAGKASCESPGIPLVDDSGGEAALENSWLWIKLTAPADTSGQLIAESEWGEPGNCDQDAAGTFGVRMPWGYAGDMLLKDESLDKIREWIVAGAPPP